MLKNQYTLITKNRKNQKGWKGHGGIAILIKKNIGKTKIIEGKRHDGIIWIEISCGGRKIFLASIYMVPVGSPFYEENDIIRKELEKYITEFKDQGIVIVAGDFNSRIGNLMSITSEERIYKRNNVDKEPNQNGKKLIKLMNGLGMIILSGIRKQTKYTCCKQWKDKMRKSVVDHFCIQEGVIESIIEEETRDDIMEIISTDHAMVSITLRLKIIVTEIENKKTQNTNKNKKKEKKLKSLNKISNRNVWRRCEKECNDNTQYDNLVELLKEK